MGNDKSVVVRREYGKIEYHFREVMEQKHINRNQLAQRAGVRFEVADHFYHGGIERMDMDVLARILFVLDCDISDVMRYSNK